MAEPTNESTDAPTNKRRPVRAVLKIEAKEPGGRRPYVEGRWGGSLDRLTERWHHVERIIDRRNNRYQERITDELTGEVVRDVDEPLSEHRGRGDAKPRKSPRLASGNSRELHGRPHAGSAGRS